MGEPRAAVVELPFCDWTEASPESVRCRATDELESGAVISLPGLEFGLSPAELALLDPRILAKAKNVSYDPAAGNLGGSACVGAEAEVLSACLARFSRSAAGLVHNLLPAYGPLLEVKRASLRPAEIAGRASSWRKDDTLLHVDAFPSQPTRGARILRVFSNVNPQGKPRVWRLGEPFEAVAGRFLPGIRRPLPGSARMLRLMRVTKNLRSEYDHTMLRLHDAMKSDLDYQTSVGGSVALFEPGTTWIVYADSVSHAALSGQHQFEQTFLLPVRGMHDPDKSPLRILERMRGRKLA
ncbi:MAG: Kdo hydroxylase family protein [Opitutaceae bacterium]